MVVNLCGTNSTRNNRSVELKWHFFGVLFIDQTWNWFSLIFLFYFMNSSIYGSWMNSKTLNACAVFLRFQCYYWLNVKREWRESKIDPFKKISLSVWKMCWSMKNKSRRSLSLSLHGLIIVCLCFLCWINIVAIISIDLFAATFAFNFLSSAVTRCFLFKDMFCWQNIQ